MSARNGPPISDDGRYWFDGDSWHLIQQPAPSSFPTGKIVWAIVVALAIVLIGLWVINGLATSNDELECATENANRSLNGEAPIDCPQ